jgi:hypothetical protein
MAEAVAPPGAPEIAAWLAAIRPDLAVYASVFVEDGARSASDLKSYEEADWPVLEAQLEKAGCARFPRKRIRDKLLRGPVTTPLPQARPESYRLAQILLYRTFQRSRRPRGFGRHPSQRRVWIS